MKVENDEALLIQYAKEGKKINVELNDKLFGKMYPLSHKEMTEKYKDKYMLKIDLIFNEKKKFAAVQDI